MQETGQGTNDLMTEAMQTTLLEKPSDDLLKEYLVVPPWFQIDLDDIRLEYEKRMELKAKNLRNASRLLFVGPPGTGKTIMSRYVADELGLDFYSVRADRMVHSLYGYEERIMGKLWDELCGGASNLDKALEEAEDEIKKINTEYFQPQCRGCGKPMGHCHPNCSIGQRLLQLANQVFNIKNARAPKVVLMDEIEMFATSRGSGDTPKDKALTILLERLEDFKGDSIFIGATNMGDKIDKAIWRRFDKIVEFQLPDLDQRVAVIDARLKDEFKKKDRDRFKEYAGICNGLSFSEIRAGMDKALKRVILNNQPDLLPDLVKMCLEAEVRTFKLSDKSHLKSNLQPTPNEGFARGKKEFDFERVM